jgi:hypothetical protein
MVNRYIYKIKDKYFKDFPDDYLKQNKDENRPCYFCFYIAETGISWMIPMSKKIEKYRGIIEKKKSANKPYDILHIARLDNGEESAFLIQDMFPVTEEYIMGEYTIGGNALRITSDTLAAAIEQKARRIYNLIHKGIRIQPLQPDVLKIEQLLLGGATQTIR